MPRKRMIFPEFWSDEEIGTWSYQARLFYIGLWNFADDEGRFKAHPNLLKSQIFPYELKINMNSIMKEVSSKVIWYECEGLQYGFVRNFNKHQRIDKPQLSKLPIPPSFQEDSKNNLGTIQDESRLREVKRSKEKRREEKLIEEKDTTPTKDFEDKIIQEWNDLVKSIPSLSTIKAFSGKRRESLRVRIKEGFLDAWPDILKAIKEQIFLQGKNDREWKISIDWLLLNDTNYLKVLERKYKNEYSDLPEILRPDRDKKRDNVFTY